MTQGMFKLKDNIRRWMACKNPPWTAQRLAKELDYDHREGNCEEDECNEDEHRRDCEERIRARFPVYF